MSHATLKVTTNMKMISTEQQHFMWELQIGLRTAGRGLERVAFNSTDRQSLQFASSYPWRTSMSRWHMGHRGAVAVFAVAVALRSHWAQQGPHAVCDAKISL